MDLVSLETNFAVNGVAEGLPTIVDALVSELEYAFGRSERAFAKSTLVRSLRLLGQA